VALGERPVLDPALSDSPASAQALWLVYTPPLTYRRAEGAQGTELVPGVGRALPKVSGDGRTYVLRVRSDLRYSNGRPVRARDVRHSILRARSLGAAGPRLFAGVIAIRTDDRNRTVRIRLRRPDPSFPHALAAVQAGVVPAGTPLRDTSRRPPPGVGPYRIRVSGRGFVLLRNRGFELPDVPEGLIDALAFRPSGSPADQVEAVIGGRLDVMTAVPPPERLPELRSELRDQYFEQPDLATRFLGVRADREPFSTPSLREALALAIDKPEAARLLAGLVRPTCNLLPSSMEGYAEADPCPWGDPGEHPDLVRAEELVEQADAEGERVLVYARPPDRRIARSYVETLGKIGLRSSLTRIGPADVTLSTARARLPDPARFLVRLARRVPLYVDPKVLLLADDLRSATEPDRASEVAEQLDSELVEGGVVIPYGAPTRTLFLSARIDADNCLRHHPVYGADLSSLCLR
jgi:peptide/nickel transport system substrate-binding protein